MKDTYGLLKPLRCFFKYLWHKGNNFQGNCSKYDGVSFPSYIFQIFHISSNAAFSYFPVIEWHLIKEIHAKEILLSLKTSIFCILWITCNVFKLILIFHDDLEYYCYNKCKNTYTINACTRMVWIFIFNNFLVIFLIIIQVRYISNNCYIENHFHV